MQLKSILTVLSLCFILSAAQSHAAAAKESEESVFDCCWANTTKVAKADLPHAKPTNAAKPSAPILLPRPTAPIAQPLNGRFAVIQFSKTAACDQKKWDEVKNHFHTWNKLMACKAYDAKGVKETVGKIAPFFLDKQLTGGITVNLKKHATPVLVQMSTDSLAFKLSNLREAPEKTLIYEHISELPQLLKEYRAPGETVIEFYREQICEILESVSAGLQKKVIKGDVSLEVQ